MKKCFAILMLLIVIDPLAVAQENDVYSRLDQHDTRMGAIEQGMDTLKGEQKAEGDKIIWIDGSTFRAHDRINGLDNKTDTTNNTVLQLKAMQNAQNITLNDHENQLERNTRGIVDTNIRIDGITTELNTKASNDALDTVNNNVSNVAQQMSTVEGGITKLEDRTNSVEAHTANLADQAAATEAQAARTEARTGQLEHRADDHDARTGKLEARTTATEYQTGNLEREQTTTRHQVETNRTDILRIGSTVDNAILHSHDQDLVSSNPPIEKLNDSINRVDQASIARAHHTLDQSKQYTDQKAAALHGEINDVRGEERAGIASITALSSVPAVAGKTFDIGVGMGNFKDSSAVAIGMHYRPSDSNVFRLGVAASNSASPVIGAGFSCGW